MKKWMKLSLVLCRGKCFINELFHILVYVSGLNSSEFSTKLEFRILSLAETTLEWLLFCLLKLDFGGQSVNSAPEREILLASVVLVSNNIGGRIHMIGAILN